MQYGPAAAEVGLSITVPVLVLWLEPRSKLVRFLSPVVVSYLAGMLLGNQPWIDFPDAPALFLCSIAVALAIPLLLFSVDLVAWFKLARETVLSFVLAMGAVMVSGTAAHLLLGGLVGRSPEVSGMLVGVYTGGTPNMAAIGTALGVPSETFVMLNAADMVASFAYLLFILVIAVRLPGWMFPRTSVGGDGQGALQETQKRTALLDKGRLAAFALSVMVVVAGAAVSILVPQSAKEATAILVITSLAVAASFRPSVRALPGTHDSGQFLLLVFCVAMGFTTDFSKLFTSSLYILAYTSATLWGAVVLHFVVASIFRIDRDTVIITSTAAIFGPHMVGPVCVSLKNRGVLFSGLASGLVGYAAGNYLGVGLAWLLGHGGVG